MFDEATREFVEGGCALIVGTVAPDGLPHATRGWGLDVLDDRGTVRLLLAADDEVTLQNLAAGGRIAITTADVPTLHSMQLKGRALGTEPATDADRARAGRFVDAFFHDITETEGVPRRLLERLLPEDYVACTVVVEELFNQTPGPAAGVRVGAPR